MVAMPHSVSQWVSGFMLVSDGLVIPPITRPGSKVTEVFGMESGAGTPAAVLMMMRYSLPDPVGLPAPLVSPP
ncbi:MAG: hypothetical protein KVP17_003728 [Porospora cf. gigantea B]|uniref:uncharacterized protein n=1 Tax=Porospora cf. gigantea B TaxID=2853592 RepID=UPI003571F824|nr:MAG: hypothetical protein KVP17_003728 [Porospora cf. gigantea B]